MLVSQATPNRFRAGCTGPRSFRMQGRLVFRAGLAVSCETFRQDGGHRFADGLREAHRFTATLPLATWPRGGLETRRGPCSIDQPGHEAKAMRQVCLLISHDHGETHRDTG